jgi:hypothetical protein
LSPETLERLRAAARATRPWELTRGPKTAAGKARSAANGRYRQKGVKSLRELHAELQAELADGFTFIQVMNEVRCSLL